MFADESDGILQMPEIDRVDRRARVGARVLPRRAGAARQEPRPCPCGVDTEVVEAVRRAEGTATAVVYWKSGDEAFCEQVEAIVRRCGLEPRRLQSLHGEHAHVPPADYRRLLDGAAIGVFLSTFETQGLALAEAWSMDVPTLVWDPQGEAEWRGRSVHVAILGAVSHAGDRPAVAHDRRARAGCCAAPSRIARRFSRAPGCWRT